MFSLLKRVRSHAVPVVPFVIVAVAVIIVPPLVLGEVTVRTYAITAAVVILAVGAALTYALFVGTATLAFLYTGIAYALAAAVLGAIGLGAQIGTPTGPHRAR